MGAKGRAITIAGEFRQSSHHGASLVIQTFDQQVMPVGLCDDLLVAEQTAQLPLQRGVWQVKLACRSSITMRHLVADSLGNSI